MSLGASRWIILDIHWISKWISSALMPQGSDKTWQSQHEVWSSVNNLPKINKKHQETSRDIQKHQETSIKIQKHQEKSRKHRVITELSLRSSFGTPSMSFSALESSSQRTSASTPVRSYGLILFHVWLCSQIIQSYFEFWILNDNNIIHMYIYIPESSPPVFF